MLSFDPKGLTESLELNEDEQQDAQESVPKLSFRHCVDLLRITQVLKALHVFTGCRVREAGGRQAQDLG